MKPPNSDVNRPGGTPGSRPPEAGQAPAPSPVTASTAPGAKADAVPVKTDASGLKAEASKGTGPVGVGPKPASPATVQPVAPKPPDFSKLPEAPKPPEASKAPESPKPVDGPKVVEIGRPADVKPPDVTSASPKPAEPLKQPEASKETAKVESVTSDPSKETPKTATFPSSAPGSTRPAGAATDGPIIDLKAKRLPDPTPTPKASTPGSGPGPAQTKPSDSKTADSKVADPKGGDPKTAPGGSTGDATKAPGGTTPKISSAPPVAPAPRGPGFGSVATAGLLGGVIGAGLLFAVDRAGVLPRADDGRLAALDQRIAALAPKDEIARLSQRVAANETALKAVPEAVSTAREALQKASATPPPAGDGTAPQAATVPADIAARLDSLDQRISALQEEPGQQGAEARMAVAPANGDTAQVTALSDRLKAVEAQVAGVRKPAEQPDLAPKLAALQTALDTRAKANADATQTLGQKLTEVQQALDAKVQAAAQASQQAAEAGKTQAAEAAKGIERQIQTQIQAQGEKIAGLDKALSGRAETATVQAALRVVAADRIVTAVTAGTPYADALAALRNYEPGDPARLTAVAVFADRGAPTAQALAAEFRTVADRITASRRAAQVRTVVETGDFGQKLMSMAESIVQVRKVETPPPSAQGTPPTADPLPKVQDALDRGAIGEAAQAFAALPEDVRTQAGEFGTRLKSRASAGEAARALLAEAFKGLPGAGGGSR